MKRSNLFLSFERHKKFISVFILTVFIISGFPLVANASTETYQTSKTVTIVPNYWRDDLRRLSGNVFIFEVPDYNYAITYVRYSIRYNGGTNMGQVWATLCFQGKNGYVHDVGKYYHEVYGNSPSGWTTREMYCNPEAGDKPIFRIVAETMGFVTSRGGPNDSYSWTIRLDEIRYVKYKWDEIKAEVTPEKFVKLTLTRSEEPYTLIRIENLDTGWANAGSGGGTYGVRGKYGTYTVTDTSVSLEHTYTYRIYTMLASPSDSTDIPKEDKTFIEEITVTVPSDATLARDAAYAAKEAAEQTRDYTWTYDNDGVTVKSAAVLAKEARDKADQALSAINNLQSSIINNFSPFILKISGLNGATCTTGNTFDVIVQAIGATEFRVKADTGGWSEWTPIGSPATATGISGTGAHTIFVEVRNAAGATSTGQMLVFKL